MKWLPDVTPDKYGDAWNYLTLRLDNPRAGKAVSQLRNAEIIQRKARDILRACRYTPLTAQDPGIIHITANPKPRSPVLMVSYDTGADIADGYHRVNAAYLEDPEQEIPLKIVPAQEDTR